MSIIEFSNPQELMRKAASDPALVKQLATFAHLLGFGWCSGTRSEQVGEDFDLVQERDRVTMKAHYDPKDPYAGGDHAHQRLAISFRNFRLDVNGGDFRYAAPRVTQKETLGLASVWARNASSVEDTVTQSFTYATTETITHTAGAKISVGAGVKVQATGGASVPFLAEGKITAEASLMVTTEGSYGYANARSSTTTHTAVYTGRVKPRSQRLIKLSVTKAEADVDYTSEGVLVFDVTLSGFLRPSGNALRTHPTDRPMYECHLMDKAGALGAIRWLADNDRPNASRWDLDWIRKQGWGASLDAVLDYARTPMRARLNGTFKIAAGFDATVVGGEDFPLTDAPATSAEVAAADDGPPGLAAFRYAADEPRAVATSSGD
ncbi:MAG: aerolysin family beta-barrel pore-forming toxin [Myxococcales bacterium]|nr:aerolysin family beta-barrel pore-forming toxin [Myxococcales bacterium]